MQMWLAALVGRYLAFALRTTRWTLEGEANFAPHAAGAPAVAAFWHECLPLMPALWMRARAAGGQHGATRIHVLVSRHNDGRLVGEVMRHFGVAVVYGSSARAGQDKGGATGVRQLLDVLATGSHVGLTPDGPRGPARQAAPGVAQLAGLSGVPVLPCAARITRRIVLNSWDRLILPLPWGRGVLVCLPPIAVPRQDWETTLPTIEAALTEAAKQAEQLCAKGARR